MKKSLLFILVLLSIFVLGGCLEKDDKDTKKPVVTIVGEKNKEINLGANYVDDGAKGTDDTDGDITSKIIVKGNVDTSKSGTYKIEYSVTDKAGNVSDVVIRTVTVKIGKEIPEMEDFISKSVTDSKVKDPKNDAAPSFSIKRDDELPTSAYDIFNPYTEAMSYIYQSQEHIQELVKLLNTMYLPDNLETDVDLGVFGECKITITYDEGRKYAKRIEIERDDQPGNPFLQINYNKGEVKGTFIYKPKVIWYNIHLVKAVKLYYDGTKDEKTMEGKVDFEFPTNWGFTKLNSTYFTATLKDKKVNIEGGLDIDFVFGEFWNYKAPYKGNHIYYYRSITDISEETELNTITDLYFPTIEDINVADDITENNSISIELSEILFYLVNNQARVAITNALNAAEIDYTTNAETLVNSLNTWKENNPNDNTLNVLMFILNLENPVAFSLEGYKGNGEDFISANEKFKNIGNLDLLKFSMDPSDIKALNGAVDIEKD